MFLYNQLYRWYYRGGHPNAVAKVLNNLSASLHARGVLPNYMVTLEVTGRKSGKTVRFPLVMVVKDGERYLVSMLGEDVNWVHNLRAAGGKAVLLHGAREEIVLEEVEVSRRAPILKDYLRRAPGARPHMPISKDAPLAEFEKIAAQYPVFRVKAAVGPI